MPLINCKAELKLKWTKYCVLSATCTNNIDGGDDNNVIFTIKDTKSKNYQNFLAKDLKDQFIGMNIKQKVRIKIQKVSLDIFSNQIFLESIDYLF